VRQLVEMQMQEQKHSMFYKFTTKANATLQHVRCTANRGSKIMKINFKMMALLVSVGIVMLMCGAGCASYYAGMESRANDFLERNNRR